VVDLTGIEPVTS